MAPGAADARGNFVALGFTAVCSTWGSLWGWDVRFRRGKRLTGPRRGEEFLMGADDVSSTGCTKDGLHGRQSGGAGTVALCRQKVRGLQRPSGGQRRRTDVLIFDSQVCSFSQNDETELDLRKSALPGPAGLCRSRSSVVSALNRAYSCVIHRYFPHEQP